MTRNIYKDAGKNELLVTVSEDINLSSHYGNQWEAPWGTKIRTRAQGILSQHAMLPHPCLVKHYSHCPRHGTSLEVHQQINGSKMCCRDILEFYSSIKKNATMSFAEKLN